MNFDRIIAFITKPFNVLWFIETAKFILSGAPTGLLITDIFRRLLNAQSNIC